MLEWLLAPMDAARVHDVGWQLSWHARLMVVAWGVLVPCGIIVARYFKVVPSQNWPQSLDNHFWWNTHRICQYGACVLMVVGVWLVQSAPRLNVLPGPHWYFGWISIALACVQITGGILRGTKGGPTESDKNGSLRGDHFDMTRRRLMFEVVHKGAGYLALAMSAAAILTGLWQANAPNWMPVGIVLWWCFLVFCSVIFQRRKMAIDTYQAIWGPDPNLPGNRRKPLGIGISRRD